MIGRTTIFWIVLALALGTGLFQVKHEVQILEGELRELNRAILADQEAIHVLEAEWAYLNRPRRLEALSERHTELAPLAAAQIVAIDDLPLRLDTADSEASDPTAAGGASPLARESTP